MFLLNFFVLQEERLDQDTQMSYAGMPSPWLLFDAHYFELCLSLFIQSQDFVMLYWILYKQLQS